MSFWDSFKGAWPFGGSQAAASGFDDDQVDQEPEAGGSGHRGFGTPRILEAVFTQNPDMGTEFDDRFFQQLSGAGSVDLPQQMQQTIQRLCLLLYRKNPRGYCAIELLKDFCLGQDGLNFKANDDKVQDLLEEHWEVNEWSERQFERFRSASIFGELVMPAFVRKSDGLVSLSSISPLNIVRIGRNPADASDLIAVIAAMELESEGSAFRRDVVLDTKSKKFDIIKRPRGEKDLAGEAFFFRLNAIDGSTRGLPDLTASVDWLEGLDGFLFSVMERAEIANDVVFDLEVKGADKRKLKTFAREFMRSLRAGECYAHNEKVTLGVTSPDLGALDADRIFSMLLRNAQAGTRLAGLFFGDSADLTRASASEISIPVVKRMEARQGETKRMFERIFDFQIQQGVKAKRISKDADLGYTLELPVVMIRDLHAIAGAMSDLEVSLSGAVDKAWLTNAEAGDVFRSVVEQLGKSLTDPTLDANALPEALRGYVEVLGARTISKIVESAAANG